MSGSALQPGTVFAGRYRIERQLGAGGMGAVYEATHLETERRRALKVMRPEIVRSAELRQRFRQEARVAARIDSELVVDVFDAGIDEATGLPFLVMELLKGEELSERLERAGRFSPAAALAILSQVARALDKSHQAGVVHRDLKPENIFLTEREDGGLRVKILDFGIAKILEGTVHAKATRNLGTPLFMAPEQLTPGAGVVPETDVYALGMVAFALLTGSAYWLDELQGEASVFTFAQRALKGPAEPAAARARRRGVALPEAFSPWFAKLTAPAPADRYRSAGQAIAALAEALALPLAPSLVTGSAAAAAAAAPTLQAAIGPPGQVVVPSGAAAAPLAATAVSPARPTGQVVVPSGAAAAPLGATSAAPATPPGQVVVPSAAAAAPPAATAASQVITPLGAAIPSGHEQLAATLAADEAILPLPAATLPAGPAPAAAPPAAATFPQAAAVPAMPAMGTMPAGAMPAGTMPATGVASPPGPAAAVSAAAPPAVSTGAPLVAGPPVAVAASSGKRRLLLGCLIALGVIVLLLAGLIGLRRAALRRARSGGKAAVTAGGDSASTTEPAASGSASAGDEGDDDAPHPSAEPDEPRPGVVPDKPRRPRLRDRRWPRKPWKQP